VKPQNPRTWLLVLRPGFLVLAYLALVYWAPGSSGVNILHINVQFNNLSTGRVNIELNVVLSLIALIVIYCQLVAILDS
jgi:hypothetical protein